MQQRVRPGRATWDEHVDGKNLVHAPERRVVTSENPSANATCSNRHNHFGVRRGAISLRERQFHVSGDGSRHQEHIGVPRRSNKMNTQPFYVVDGIVQSRNLNLAAIAGAGVHFADGNRSPQNLMNAGAYFLCQPLGRFFGPVAVMHSPELVLDALLVDCVFCRDHKIAPVHGGELKLLRHLHGAGVRGSALATVDA